MKILCNIALLAWLLMQTASASELLPGLSDNVTCYQHGTPILKTQNRVREFVPSESMKLLVDVNLGQVSETHMRIYASTIGEVTCVLTSQK
jgi:hypothetical protein